MTNDAPKLEAGKASYPYPARGRVRYLTLIWNTLAFPLQAVSREQLERIKAIDNASAPRALPCFWAGEMGGHIEIYPSPDRDYPMIVEVE